MESQFIVNDDLTKWQLLLSQLDLDLQCFCGPNYLPYPYRVSTLNEAELEDFVSQQGLVWPKGCLPNLTESQLKDFESQTGLILPQGYREFCQVFGAGKFGLERSFFIDNPDIDDIEAQLGSNQCILEACKGNLEAYKGNYYSSRSNEIDELLDNAYLFGGGSGLVAFVFDLRTYNEQDSSYDIYGINCDSDFVCYLGRDFFEFVRDICIGERAQAEFPELLLGGLLDFDRDDPAYKSTTFFLYPVDSKLPDEEPEQSKIEEEEENDDEDYWLT